MKRTDGEKRDNVWLCKSRLVLGVRLSTESFGVWVERL